VKRIIDFLERFNCRTVLNGNNSKRVITEIAKQELIQKPQLMAATWQPILSELEQCEVFQSLDKLNTFYDSIKPTNKKVLQMLVAEPITDAERDALKCRGTSEVWMMLNCSTFSASPQGLMF
jgi:hypothetical protein